MAGNASGAWKATLNTGTPKPSESSFPGLSPGAVDAASKVDNTEVQKDELLVLDAIYGDDFVDHTGEQSAWKKTEPTFDIRIVSSIDEDFSLILGFVLNASYPKTPPLTTPKNHEHLREALRFKIQKFLETQPPIFAQNGEAMVMQIVDGVREILDDAAQLKAAGKDLPSLEVERERHEAKLAEAAQRQKEKEEQARAEQSMEEERMMAAMVQKEMDRKEQSAKESKQGRRANGTTPQQPSNSNAADTETLEFDQFCNITDRTGNPLAFRAVAGKCEPRKGQICVVYTVRPMLSNGQGTHTMALKEAVLRPAGGDIKDFKKQLQALEAKLQDLKHVKGLVHRHLVEMLDFKVETNPTNNASPSNSWKISILMPLADKGPLEELLELAGRVELGRVRSWTRDLLDALNFLHNKSVYHGDIHTSNILLFRDDHGEIIPKISDISYQRELHGFCRKRALPGMGSAKSAYWLPPEIAGASKPTYSSKTDIWDFGVVFVQMIFGLDVLRKYSSPKNLMDSLNLSQSLKELVSRYFKEDKNKRPRAFELSSSEFLATDAPVLREDSSIFGGSTTSLNNGLSTLPKLRRESMNRTVLSSRYAEDFQEEGRLGKGGFGEVVRARKKLDGQIYAIKKITQRSQASLTEILKEVRLLSQLSHPAVVRYYNTWVEEIADTSSSDADTSTEGFTSETQETGETGSAGIDIQFTSTGGLDFISSQPAIEFEDDDYEEDEDDDDETEGELSSDDDGTESRVGSPVKERNMPGRARFQRPYRTILYISMEYCEKKTLRDLILRDLYKNTDEIWRLFRQVLEGLAHIHSLSIVHRDLKPENVFISSSTDGMDNVKIGDFGLATSGQFSVDRANANTVETDDLTKSIGTASYSAPEVRSAVNGMYSTKVDMYSLGIIFFEMCYVPMLGMQKADVIGALRRPQPVLPVDFNPKDVVQKDIVLSLISHNPRERPSSAELLKSGKLPVQMESETIRRTLAGLSDPSSPYYRKMLSTLFARQAEPAKDYAWDMSVANPTTAELLNQGIVKESLISIFRRHGALEASRTPVYPRSSHYADNAVQLLDQNGMVLQLPYDLTLGQARLMAKPSSHAPVQRTFAFGNVFRDQQDGGSPRTFGEVDFDIVTTDTLDLALKEAEVLKVLDEIILTFPTLAAAQMCFHVGHSDLLQLIFEYCGVNEVSRKPAADVLSKLNIHGHTWQKIKGELRSPAVGISATSVDELQRFDFRDTPNKTFSKLKTIFEGTDIFQRASPTIAHLKEVAGYTKLLGVATKIYINPLNSLKESFYYGGILFSCLYDKKLKEVFAAGGRYDHLIKEHRPKIGGQEHKRHAVGFSLAWERLARTPKPGKHFVKKGEEEGGGLFGTKRCDALIASFDGHILRTAGIELLQTLWSHDISAELSRDTRSPEDLLQKHRDESYSWIIIIKQDSMLKIKTLGRKDVPDADVQTPNLLSWLRAEMRERDSRSLAKPRSGPSHTETTPNEMKRSEQDVKVLSSQTRSKKTNRRTVVEQAQVKAAALMESYLEGPILAVETTSDTVMEAIGKTKLSDPEGWRKVEHNVTTSEKRYVREIHEQLESWRWRFENEKGPSRHAFVYNFRTGYCLYYDLAA